MTTPTPISRFFTSKDGLKLHMKDWGAASPALPVVCLPGLTRNAGDFYVLATRLCACTTAVGAGKAAGALLGKG